MSLTCTNRSSDIIIIKVANPTFIIIIIISNLKHMSDFNLLKI